MGIIGQIHDREWRQLGKYTTGIGTIGQIQEWGQLDNTGLSMETIGPKHDWEWEQFGKYTTGNGDNFAETNEYLFYEKVW